MSVTDEVTAVVEEHGAAVEAAARSLVTSGADAFTIDVFAAVIAAVGAGDERPTAAIVRDAFVRTSDAVRPPLPPARRAQAMRVLEQTGAAAPPWLLAAVTDLRPATGDAAPPEPGPDPRTATTAPVDSAWVPAELAAPAAPAAPGAEAPPQEWAPAAAEPAAVAEFAPGRGRRGLRAGPLLGAVALLLLLAAGGYAITRDDPAQAPAPGPAATPAVQAPTRTAAERRAERRRARAERRRARAQRRDAVKAHREDAVQSFAASARPAPAPAAPAVTAAPTASAPTAPAPPPSAPAPAPTSAPRAPAPAPTSPPPSEDPPGREAPGA